MIRTGLAAVVLFLLLAVPHGGAWAQAPETGDTRATLLVYGTVPQLLSGDMSAGIAPQVVASDLAEFPADWAITGVGSTDLTGRHGEVMPDGDTDGPEFWWADPGGSSPGEMKALHERNAAGDLNFPFIGMAIGDPSTAITLTATSVPDVHEWLEAKLDEAGIDLAGVELQGEFGQVSTSIVYSIPVTGLDLSGGYVGEDFFRFGTYPTATWTINGVLANDPLIEAIVSTAGHPLHLHGHLPGSRVGGHVAKAAVVDAVVTVWPLEQVIMRPVEPVHD